MTTDSANPLNLAPPAVLLLAADLISVSNIPSFRSLVSSYPLVLNFATCLDLLLRFLPETILPEEYLPILYRLYVGEPESGNSSRIDEQAVKFIAELSQKHLNRKVDALDLTLKATTTQSEKELELVKWFLARTRKVESETGLIDLARRIAVPLLPFPDGSNFPPPFVGIWGNGVVKVLERFVFDHDDDDELQLVAFEALDPESAINLLLSRSTPEKLAEDIRELVVPYVTYVNHSKTNFNAWNLVWDWLLDQAEQGDLDYIKNLCHDWDGPTNSNLEEYFRTCVAACYICPSTVSGIWETMHSIQKTLYRLLPLRVVDTDGTDSSTIPRPLDELVRSQLCSSHSFLTAFRRSTLDILDLFISSASLLSQYSISPDLSLRSVVTICGGSVEDQVQVAHRFLRSDGQWMNRDDEKWRKTRDSIRWLRDKSGVLGKMSIEQLESCVLSSIIGASKFNLAREIYVKSLNPPLSSTRVEKDVLEAFYTFYDNSSNGNRTRGGMNKAFQCLHILNDPNSSPEALHAVRLLSATHALTKYSLTLPSGGSIRPVQIRLHHDPIWLLVRVIECNRTAYKEVDNLLKIAHDLLDGARHTDNVSKAELSSLLIQSEARIFSAVVEGAMKENDFTTAYLVCNTKLLPILDGRELTSETTKFVKDITWRALFHTGTSPLSSDQLHQRQASASHNPEMQIFQRMELLARAMLLCSKSQLVGILNEWSSLEKLQNSQFPVKGLDSKSLQSMSSISYPEIESGRFRSQEVRGIFATLDQVGRSVSSTFPLRSSSRSRSNGNISDRIPDIAGPIIDQDSGGWTAPRLGVRDTVKTGLTRGVGWLLGANDFSQDNENGKHDGR